MENRELFALEAMKMLILERESNAKRFIEDQRIMVRSPEYIAEKSVKFADELLKELDKNE